MALGGLNVGARRVCGPARDGSARFVRRRCRRQSELLRCVPDWIGVPEAGRPLPQAVPSMAETSDFGSASRGWCSCSAGSRWSPRRSRAETVAQARRLRLRHPSAVQTAAASHLRKPAGPGQRCPPETPASLHLVDARRVVPGNRLCLGRGLRSRLDRRAGTSVLAGLSPPLTRAAFKADQHSGD
jgi:hypothetical protein